MFELWELGKRLLYDKMICMVTIRSAQNQEKAQCLPDNFKDPKENVILESESNSEDEASMSSTQPWKDTPEDIGAGRVETDSSDSEQPTQDSRAKRRKARAAYVSSRPAQPLDVGVNELKKEQRQDETLKNLWEKANKGDDTYVVENELLWRLLEDSFRVFCVPRKCRSMVLSLAHRPGHLSRDKTIQSIIDEFFWPGLNSEV